MKKLEHLLHLDEFVKRVFYPPPIVSYHSARKLSNYLVCAKLYHLVRKIGSYKCGNLRWLVCNNIEETDTFTSTTTGESFKINHHLCCNNKCLIYLLTCKVSKKQYTGKARPVNEWHVIVLACPHTCQYLFRHAITVRAKLYMKS